MLSSACQEADEGDDIASADHSSSSPTLLMAQARPSPACMATEAIPMGFLKSLSSICLVMSPAASPWARAQDLRAVFFWALVRLMFCMLT